MILRWLALLSFVLTGNVGVVRAYSLRLHQSADIDSLVTGYLTLGEGVDLTARNGDWIYVVADGVGGWAHGAYVLVNGFPANSQEERPFEGECFEDCWVTNRTWFTPAPRHTVGVAVFYGPHAMEGTARYYGFDLSEFVGGVAMESPADIGNVVWLRRPGHTWEGPYLVVDSAQRNLMWQQVAVRQQFLEVDYPTAVRWGMTTAMDGSYEYEVLLGGIEGVEVWKGIEPPPDSVSLTGAVPYVDFFLTVAALDDGRWPEANWMWSPASIQFTNYCAWWDTGHNTPCPYGETP